MVLPPTNFVTKRKKEEKQGKGREKVIQREKREEREKRERHTLLLWVVQFIVECVDGDQARFNLKRELSIHVG